MTDRTYTREQVNEIVVAIARQLNSRSEAQTVKLFNEMYDAGIALGKRLGLTDNVLGAEYEEWADRRDARYEWPEA